MKLLCRSAAKVNLTLDILRVRPDGYHELKSVVHTIGLYDDLVLELDTPPHAQGAGLTFTCTHPELSGGHNLCLRAAKLWETAAGISLSGRLHLDKRIPFGAGLGGGSGNAAATLLLLNAAFPGHAVELPSLCQGLGADVPLFLRGGCQLLAGVGDRLTPLSALNGWLLLIKPPVHLGTPQVYAAWDQGKFASHEKTSFFLQAMEQGNGPESWAKNLGNDLERAVAPLGYEVWRWLELLRRLKPLGASMTGSGSACFAVFASQDAAELAQECLLTALSHDSQTRNAAVWTAPLVDAGCVLGGPYGI